MLPIVAIEFVKFALGINIVGKFLFGILRMSIFIGLKKNSELNAL